MQDPISHYQRLLVDAPQDVELRLSLAAALGDAARVEDAARAYLEAARLLGRQRAGRRAIQACTDALRLAPNDPEILAFVERLCATNLEAGRAWREARGLASHVPAEVMPRRTLHATPYAQPRSPAPGGPSERSVGFTRAHREPPPEAAATTSGAVFQETPTTRIPALRRPDLQAPPTGATTLSIPAPTAAPRSRRPPEAARAEIDDSRTGTARGATTPAAWQTSTAGRGGSALDRLRAATQTTTAALRQTQESAALERPAAPPDDSISQARLPARAPVVQPAGLALTPASLPLAPLWSGLDEATLVAMLSNTALLRPAEDATLVDADHDPTRLFVVLSGTCELRVNAPDGAPRLAAQLTPGCLLGASELLGRIFPGRRITAQREVELLELGARTLTVLGRQDPTVWNHIWEAHYDALLRSALAISPIFVQLKLPELEAVLARFKRAWARAGEPLIRDAATQGGLLLLLNGTLEIHRAAAAPRLLNVGELFDAGVTARAAQRFERILAAENTTAALLPRTALTELARTYPAIIDGFKRWSL